MLFPFTEIQRDKESFFFEFVWMGVFIRIDAVSRVYGHWPWSTSCHNRDRIILFFKAIHCHVICNKPRFNRYYRISYRNLMFSWLSHPLGLGLLNFRTTQNSLFIISRLHFQMGFIKKQKYVLILLRKYRMVHTVWLGMDRIVEDFWYGCIVI